MTDSFSVGISTAALTIRNNIQIAKEITSMVLKISGGTQNNDLQDFMVSHERIFITISKSVNFGTTRSMICLKYY